MRNEFLREEVKLKFLEILEDFTLDDTITLKTYLSDLDIDDFSIQEIILRIENELDISFDIDKIHSYEDFLEMNVKEAIDELFSLII